MKVVCMALWLALAGAAYAQETGVAPPAPASPGPIPAGRVCRIRLEGDLDCARLASDFGAELDRAAQRAALIIIELDGDRSRPDLVLAAGRRLAACPVRTAAYLSDSRERRVGLGQALLAVFCTHAYIAPGTRIVHGPADELRRLAPEDTDWKRVFAHLGDEAGARIEARSGDPALPAILLTARGGAWFTASSEGERIETEEPPRGSTQFVFSGTDGPDRVELDSGLAVSLRLVHAVAKGPAAMMDDLGVAAGASRSTATLSSGLADAESRLEASIRDLRVAVQRIEESLRVTSGKLDRRPLPGDYRKAGRDALARIGAAERGLEALEQLTADYPELLRDEAATPSAARARVLADFRRDLARHRASAEEYRTRR